MCIRDRMYTLNGAHPDLSVDQQYLEEGDVIVFHYTDYDTKEMCIRDRCLPTRNTNFH